MTLLRQIDQAAEVGIREADGNDVGQLDRDSSFHWLGRRVDEHRRQRRLFSE